MEQLQAPPTPLGHLPPLGVSPPAHAGAGGAAPLTYKHGMYTRLPTITSINSSGEQSSRKSTSALKISEGLRLRATSAPAAPQVPASEGPKRPGKQQSAERDLGAPLPWKFYKTVKWGSTLMFSTETRTCKV